MLFIFYGEKCNKNRRKLAWKSARCKGGQTSVSDENETMEQEREEIPNFYELYL